MRAKKAGKLNEYWGDVRSVFEKYDVNPTGRCTKILGQPPSTREPENQNGENQHHATLVPATTTGQMNMLLNTLASQNPPSQFQPPPPPTPIQVAGDRNQIRSPTPDAGPISSRLPTPQR